MLQTSCFNVRIEFLIYCDGDFNVSGAEPSVQVLQNLPVFSQTGVQMCPCRRSDEGEEPSLTAQRGSSRTQGRLRGGGR